MNELSESVEVSEDKQTVEGYADGEERRILPSYVYKSNLLERQTFLKESSLVDSNAVRLFNAICDYATQVGNETAVINLKDFALFAETNKLSEFASPARNEPLIKKIEESLGPNGVGVFEIVEYGEEAAPLRIMLSERDNEQTFLYKKVEKYIMNCLSEVKEKKGKLKTDVDILKEFKLYETMLMRLFVDVKVSGLSQAKIKELSENRFTLVRVDLEHAVGKIVFPSNKLDSVILFFVVLVYEYYEDSPNDNLRHLIRERLNRQKLDERNIISAFKKARLQDNYFLFFTQLFFTIMNSLMDKFAQQNVVNTEVFNQLIASRMLSMLSFNQRQLMREEQQEEEVRLRKLRATLEELVMKSVNKGGEQIYYPLSMADLLNATFKGALMEKGQQRVVNERIKDVFKQSDVEEYIESLNAVGHSIKEVISFSAGGQTYYVHRSRLMQSFWSMISIESAKIRSKIVREWSRDIQKVVAKITEDDLEELIRVDMLSNFFRSYHKTVCEILLSNSSIDGRQFDAEYMLSRLFFSERERALFPAEAKSLMYREGDFKKKKNFLKSFFNTVINKNYSIKKYRELFKLNISSLKEDTLAVADVGALSRISISLIDLMRDLRIDGLADFIISFSEFIAKIFGIFSFTKKKKDVSNSKVGSFANSEEIDRPSSYKESSSKESSSPSATAKVKEDILNSLPELRNDVNIKEKLDELENKWNNKLGEAREELRDKVDQRVFAFIARCEPSMFVEKKMDAVMERFRQLNQKLAAEIPDKDSLSQYVFYKAALAQVKK